MSDVDIAREGPVLTIEFSRPDKSNPMTADAVERILEAMTGKESSDLALMVFRGQGRNFCSGFDLTGLEAATDADLLFRILRVETLLQAVFHAPFVTLALAHGNVVGAGADLFCACALRIATPETTFRMPGLKFGVALGTLAAVRHNTWIDSATMAFALFGIAMPNFWFGLVLISIFSLALGWLPLPGPAGEGTQQSHGGLRDMMARPPIRAVVVIGAAAPVSVVSSSELPPQADSEIAKTVAAARAVNFVARIGSFLTMSGPFIP